MEEIDTYLVFNVEHSGLMLDIFNEFKYIRESWK